MTSSRERNCHFHSQVASCTMYMHFINCKVEPIRWGFLQGKWCFIMHFICMLEFLLLYYTHGISTMWSELLIVNDWNFFVYLLRTWKTLYISLQKCYLLLILMVAYIDSIYIENYVDFSILKWIFVCLLFTECGVVVILISSKRNTI